MLDHQPSKNLIIFDPYTTNGFLLAQKLLTKGYSVLLFTNTTKTNLLVNSSSEELKPQLSFCDITKGCIDNYASNEFFQQSEYLIIINSLADKECIFDTQYDFKNELHAAQLKYNLSLFAKENQIKIIESGIWHCSPAILDLLITAILDFLRNESERRLYLNTLHCDFFLMENSTYLEILEQSVDTKFGDDLIIETQSSQINIRDIFRLVFEELGAEIEFCGRAEHERGVIVDYDEDVLSPLKFDSSKIRLGNTVVKINEQKYNIINDIIKSGFNKENTFELRTNILSEIKRLVKSKTYN